MFPTAMCTLCDQDSDKVGGPFTKTVNLLYGKKKIHETTGDLCASSSVIQWNPSIADTIGNQPFAPYSEVSLTQQLLVSF